LDPVNLQRKKLLNQGISEAEIIKIEDDINRRIEISLRRAKEAPFADNNELYRGVFS
jgi:TPP-dependent pyruvate/acetoin dehydrogenase alpha subunit